MENFNAILTQDRKLKNIVSVDEAIARSDGCPIDIAPDDIFVENAPPIPDEMFKPILAQDGLTWSESAEGLAMKAEHEANLQAKAAAQAVSDAKALGFDYNGTMVPVTNADAIGALQIAYGFEQMGMAATNFHLSSGVVLPLTAAEWPTFKAAFFAARAAFFQ